MKRQLGYAQLIMIGVALAVGLGAVFVIYNKGYDAGYSARVEEDREAELAQEAIETAASVELEQDREKTRTVYRTITREVDRVVEKPVYRDVCFDPDGLRLANAALAGALVAAGEPDRGVPDAGAARGREGSDGPAEADRGGRDLPRLPRPASPPGGGGAPR